VKRETLDNYLADNVEAWLLHSDGLYRREVPGPGEIPYSAQAILLAQCCGAGA
jgi:polyphosphate kinase